MNEITLIEQTMREYADNPAAEGYVPVFPSTLRKWADEVSALRADVAMLAAAEARAQGAEADARRYRWLREYPWAVKDTGVWIGNEELDRTIDAAIAHHD